MIDNVELNNELKRFYSEKKITEETLFYEQQNFANAIKNGIGEELKKYLENSHPYTKKNIWNKIINYFNKHIKKII